MISLTVLFGLFAALSKTGKSVVVKTAAQATNEYLTTATMRIITTIILLPLAVYFGGPNYIDFNTQFWIAVTANTILLGTIGILITKAYKLSDVSLISPLLGFTPIVTILPTVLLVDDEFTTLGIIGVLLTSIGGFIALSDGNFQKSQFKNAINDKGVYLIGMVLLIVGFIPPFDKIGVQQTSPIVWPTVINLTSGIFVLIALSYFQGYNKGTLKKNWKVLLLVSIFHAGIWYGQAAAYELANPAYVVSIKRVSIIFTVLIGNQIYNEENLKWRLIGSSLIVIGVLLLTTAL